MTKRLKMLPKWSPHSLWLGQCSRRLWLYRPPIKLSPPITLNEHLGYAVHNLISQVLKGQRDLCLAKLQEEFCRELAQAQGLGFEIEDRFVLLGKRALNNFYQKYAIEGDFSNVIASELKVATRMSQQGKIISEWDSKEKPYYELFGRVDEIHCDGDSLVIRDFKLRYNAKNKDRIFQQKLQLGIYKTCFEPSLEKYSCTNILGEIFDLSDGRIIPVEAFSTGKVHSLVKQTEKRILARNQGYNSTLCPTCVYKTVCDRPYNPPLGWKRPREDFSSQLSLADILDASP